MPKKLFYRNARDAIPALSTSRTDIDDDAAGAAVGVAKENPLERADNRSSIQPFYDRNLNLVRLLSAHRVQKPLSNSISYKSIFPGL